MAEAPEKCPKCGGKKFNGPKFQQKTMGTGAHPERLVWYCMTCAAPAYTYPDDAKKE